MGKSADDLSGTWSSSWGDVQLDVEGSKVTGTWAEGGLEGTVDGNAVKLTWTHNTGTSGKCALEADADFANLKGTWGFDDADAGEGDWELKQTKRKPKPKPKPEPKAKPKPKPKPKPK